MIIYWIIIRRCGQLSVTENFNGKWDDQLIHEGGVEMSLMNKMRTSVKNFVNIPIVDKSVLGMTILLCVVIFAELALEP